MSEDRVNPPADRNTSWLHSEESNRITRNMTIPNKRMVVENKKVKEENINDSSKEKDKVTR